MAAAVISEKFQMACNSVIVRPQPVVRSTSCLVIGCCFRFEQIQDGGRRHLVKFRMAISPQRLTIYLYSAHRAVIFAIAIAQLSCIYEYMDMDMDMDNISNIRGYSG